MYISIIVPVYNEEENITPLVAEFAPVAEALDQVEVLFVDDGSTDSTREQIQDCAKNHPFLRGIYSDENRGQSAAFLSGMQEAKGDIIVTMDGDLQNDPADIPALVDAIGDVDCVCGYRARRRDSVSRRLASRLANAIRNLVTHDGIIDTGCSLKAFRKHCVGDLPHLNGVHRFMPAYFILNGRTIKQIPVNHRPRTMGTSKYTNLKRLPCTIKDLSGFSWYRRRYLARLDTEPVTRLDGVLHQDP